MLQDLLPGPSELPHAPKASVAEPIPGPPCVAPIRDQPLPQPDPSFAHPTWDARTQVPFAPAVLNSSTSQPSRPLSFSDARRPASLPVRALQGDPTYGQRGTDLQNGLRSDAPTSRSNHVPLPPRPVAVPLSPLPVVPQLAVLQVPPDPLVVPGLRTGPAVVGAVVPPATRQVGCTMSRSTRRQNNRST